MWIEPTTTKNGEVRYIFRERFTIPNTGKKKVVSVTLPSQNRHAKKVAPELLQEKFRKEVLAPIEKRSERLRTLTLWAVLDEWLDSTRCKVKLATQRSHYYTIQRVKKVVPQDTLFFDFTPRMYEQIVSDIYYKEQLSFAYAKQVLLTIKQVIRYAKKARYLKDISEFEEVTIKKRPATREELQKKANKFLDRDELKACLEQLRPNYPRIAMAVEFMALTGLRIGELLALRVRDYNAIKSMINVNGTILANIPNGSAEKRGTPKTNYSYRDVYLNPRAKYILDWMILDNRKMAFRSMGTYIDRGYIFTTSKGFPYDMPMINKLLKTIHLNSGKRITTHIFRHTHISLLAEMGMPLKAIMHRVGHHDATTTLSIYTHVTPTMNTEANKQLDKLVI